MPNIIIQVASALCLGCFSNLSIPGLVTPFPAHELGFSGDKEKKMGIDFFFFFNGHCITRTWECLMEAQSPMH